jgi:hypothetical protein
LGCIADQNIQIKIGIGPKAETPYLCYMRFAYFLLFYLIFGCLRVNGQVIYKYELGLRMIAQQTGYFNRQVNLSNYNPRPTYGRAAGLAFTWHINSRFYLTTEILNSFQGQKYSYNENEIDTSGNTISVQLYTRRFDFNYYKLPLIAGVSLHPHPRIRLEIGMGPQLAYLNTAYYVLDADTIIRKDRSFKQTMKLIDPGWVILGGMQVKPTPRLSMSIRLRMDISLFDTDSRKFKPQVYAVSKNFTAGFSYGISYSFGKINTNTSSP